MTEAGTVRQAAPGTVTIKIRQNDVDQPIVTVAPGAYVEFHNVSSITRTIQFEAAASVALILQPGAKVTYEAEVDGTIVYNCGVSKQMDGPYQVIVDGGRGGGRK